jgi:ABC-2 type transport system permease protein
MKVKPGSLLWLVRHDLLLTWRRVRAVFGKMPLWKILTIMLCGFFSLHLLAAPLALKITREIGIGGIALAMASGAMFVIPWQISQGISQSARILYSRGDLDLLLGSPISARVVAASHTLAMTIESTISIGIFLIPIVNIFAYEAGARWLIVYPVIFASALFSAGWSVCHIRTQAHLCRSTYCLDAHSISVHSGLTGHANDAGAHAREDHERHSYSWLGRVRG